MSQLLIRPIIGGPYSARDESTVYGYSGMFAGDAHSAPASFTLFDFTVGSHDLAVDLFLIEGKPPAIGAGSANGWSVTLNGTTVMTLQPDDAVVQSAQAGGWPMLWPAGTDVLVLSLNTGTGNNAQPRGAQYMGRKIINATDAGGRDRAVGSSYAYYKDEPPKGGLNPFMKAVYGITRL